MSNYKKVQTEAFFNYHPDRRLVEKLDGAGDVVASFLALFDMSHKEDNKDAANVGQVKYIPHLTFFSGNADTVRDRKTKLRVHDSFEKDDATATEWQVYRVDDDRTKSTFQAEAWLL